MKRLNPNMFPKDGFFFKEKDGAKIFADSWAGVVKRVIRYRQRAGYEPGNAEEEVNAQACARNPVLCNDDPAGHAAQLQRAPLKSRVLTWLNGLQKIKNQIQFVDEQLARERAAICASCSHNKGLPDGCASCKAAIKILREDSIGRRFQDGRLQACEILGEDLPASVHVENQALDNTGLPGHCWRKRKL